MPEVLKIVCVAAVAGTVTGCLAAVPVAAFGLPLVLAAVAAGVGAGAAGIAFYRRIPASAF